MRAYKLMRLRKDGTLGSLFINRKQVVPIGIWMKSRDFKTKGYAHRPGWDACMDVMAPHLTMKGRVWCEVEIEDYVELKRPASQGTKWFLAEKMKVVRQLDAKHDNPFDKG